MPTSGTARESPHFSRVCKQVQQDKHTYRLHINAYKLCFTAPRRHSTKESSKAASLEPCAASLLPRCSLTPMGKHTYRLPLGHSAQAAARRRHSTQDSCQAAANRSRRSAASPQTGQVWRLLGERGERTPSRDSPARTQLQSRLRQVCLQKVFRPPQAGHMWPSARPLGESGECTPRGNLCSHAMRSQLQQASSKGARRLEVLQLYFIGLAAWAAVDLYHAATPFRHQGCSLSQGHVSTGMPCPCLFLTESVQGYRLLRRSERACVEVHGLARHRRLRACQRAVAAAGGQGRGPRGRPPAQPRARRLARTCLRWQRAVPAV